MSRVCFICGENDFTKLQKFHETYEVTKCNVCASESVNPVPCEEALKDYYNNGKCNLLLDELLKARYKKEHGSDNWYDWRVNNWGTKWNSYSCEIQEQEDDYVVYTFDTAWGPPTGVIEALREQCPDFHISAFFDEPGMQEAGYY